MPPQVNEKEGKNQLTRLGLAFLMTILKRVWVQMLLMDWYQVTRTKYRAGPAHRLFLSPLTMLPGVTSVKQARPLTKLSPRAGVGPGQPSDDFQLWHFSFQYNPQTQLSGKRHFKSILKLM